MTGGGVLENAPRGRVTFGLVVQYSNGALTPSGNLIFKDHGARITLKATSFKLLNIREHHAVILGNANVNGKANIAFVLNVDDLGKGGSSDIFMIQIPAWNGYSAGGVLDGGNIRITMLPQRGR